MAKRSGIMDLPPNSLIQLTHNLADFLAVIYNKIKSEIIKDKTIRGDETPHRMLGEMKPRTGPFGDSRQTLLVTLKLIILDQEMLPLSF